jgi:glycosyltransferase involved in cell wall biosynthesis
VILFLHNRYRTTGGEERAVEDLLWLVRHELGEEAELLERDSKAMGRGRAALGLTRGGLDASEVARAVRHTRARVVHAHNLQPTLGWRALAAARAAGARVVLHLHQYRLVCAVGVCFTHGADCTRCHGRNTLPGLIHNCRGSLPEAASYAVALSAWQRRLAALADAFVVPSHFAAARLSDLGAPVRTPRVVSPVVREFAAVAAQATPDGYALVASRLSPEKGVEVAIEACRIAGIPLVIAGDGPERPRLEALSAGAAVRFAGRVDRANLEQLRRGAAVAVVPSRSAETFGLAAAEAMAAGVPVAGSRIGALPELVPDDWLAPPGDAQALAGRIARLRGDAVAGTAAIERVRRLCAPEVVAPTLAAVYAE